MCSVTPNLCQNNKDSQAAIHGNAVVTPHDHGMKLSRMRWLQTSCHYKIIGIFTIIFSFMGLWVTSQLSDSWVICQPMYLKWQMRYILWVTGMLKGVLLRNGGLRTSDMKYCALICSGNSLQMKTRQKERTDTFKVLPHVQLKTKNANYLMPAVFIFIFPKFLTFLKAHRRRKKNLFQILQGFTFLGQV